MRSLKLLAGVAAAAMAAPSMAAVSFVFVQGGTTMGTVIEDFNSAAPAGLTGANYVLQTGSNSQGASPATGDGSQYLSVLGGGNASYTFAGPGYNKLSFIWGSLDAYNSLTIVTTGGVETVVPGVDILNTLANGNQSSPNTNGRLDITSTDRIIGLRFGSQQNSFELDNISAAVPEPATWGLMIFGFGAVGVSLRRRAATRAFA